ncbi:MAG: hypothetical protein Q8M37_11105 [Nevskia sp.]|nr:hypothetical protein [Nevskia sp.]
MATVNLPASVIEQAKALTGLTTKDAAVRAAVDLAARAKPVKAAHVPNMPNAATIRALKAKPGPGDVDITSRADFDQWLKTIPVRKVR